MRTSVSICVALAFAACSNTAGPPDDLPPESFTMEIVGSLDFVVQGRARFTADGLVSASNDETPLRADWVELVAAATATALRFDFTLYFLGPTTAQVRSYTIGPFDEDFTFPNSGVVAVLSARLADGNTMDFASQDGLVRVNGMADNEIWGDLETTMDGQLILNGESNFVAVDVTGRFRARID